MKHAPLVPLISDLDRHVARREKLTREFKAAECEYEVGIRNVSENAAKLLRPLYEENPRLCVEYAAKLGLRDMALALSLTQPWSTKDTAALLGLSVSRVYQLRDHVEGVMPAALRWDAVRYGRDYEDKEGYRERSLELTKKRRVWLIRFAFVHGGNLRRVREAA